MGMVIEISAQIVKMNIQEQTVILDRYAC